MVAPCPVCRGAGAVPRYAIAGLHARLVQCPSCGLGWLDPQPAPAEIAAFYPPSYYGSTGKKFVGLIELFVRVVSRRRVRFLARRVPAGGRVLDVGCGRGTLLGELADLGFEVYGFEISGAAVEGADPRVSIRLGDDLQSAAFPDGWFDQVIIWHVLEHLPDPRATLCEIRRILKPGGEIVVAVPNFSSLQARCCGSTWFHLDPPRHLFHFPLAALRRLLEECGFAVRSEHHFSLRQNPFGWVQSALNAIPGLPRNGLYELLQRRSRREPPPFSRAMRCGLWAAFLLGMPCGVLLSIAAAALRQGATVHVVATARPE